MTVTIISQNMTMRPPNLSVHMPSGTRISEPVRTGVAVRMPNSVELRFSVFLIGTPITPNIIHTMKHTVNASVLTTSTDQAFALCDLPAPRAVAPSRCFGWCAVSACALPLFACLSAHALFAEALARPFAGCAPARRGVGGSARPKGRSGIRRKDYPAPACAGA